MDDCPGTPVDIDRQSSMDVPVDDALDVAGGLTCAADAPDGSSGVLEAEAEEFPTGDSPYRASEKVVRRRRSVWFQRTSIKRPGARRPASMNVHTHRERSARYITAALLCGGASSALLCRRLHVSPVTTSWTVFATWAAILWGFRNKLAYILAHWLHRSRFKEELSNRPRRIILIRHGQSQGNVDTTTYARVPDNQVELTETGHQQAYAAGEKLQAVIKGETVRFFVSPYKRSRQTFEGILKGMSISREMYSVREEPRLREQDWGNFQNPDQVRKCMEERRKFGSFYYRFPNGESGADVYDRVDSFWASLVREFSYHHCLENFVLISHGITIRLLLMRYFKWTIEEYHSLWNPENCEIFIMEAQSDGHYELKTKLRRNAD